MALCLSKVFCFRFHGHTPAGWLLSLFGGLLHKTKQEGIRLGGGCCCQICESDLLGFFGF